MSKHTIALTAEQRKSLERLIKAGTAPVRLIQHAQILLKTDSSRQGPAWTDQQIQNAFDVGRTTIWRVRQRFLTAGLEDALARREQPERPEKQKLDGEKEAHLIALICAGLPEGQECWSLRLLAEKLVQLGEVEQISYETVRQTLQKNKLKPWLKEQWCFAPKANAAFVADMEDVLEAYQRPYDERRPQICMDETRKQFKADTRSRLPMKPGTAERYDYEYERHGVCNLFLACEPLAGKRVVQVTQRRTKQDWAQFIRDLVDVHYPQVEWLVLVMDNLNTHVIGSLCEAFPPAEARRLVEKLEIHYTPKHGSWLNMAEIELAVLMQHGISQRVADREELRRQVDAWQDQRNQKAITVDWRFTTTDARIKLKHLYPSIDVSVEQ